MQSGGSSRGARRGRGGRPAGPGRGEPPTTVVQLNYDSRPSVRSTVSIVKQSPRSVVKEVPIPAAQKAQSRKSGYMTLNERFALLAASRSQNNNGGAATERVHRVGKGAQQRQPVFSRMKPVGSGVGNGGGKGKTSASKSSATQRDLNVQRDGMVAKRVAKQRGGRAKSQPQPQTKQQPPQGGQNTKRGKGKAGRRRKKQENVEPADLDKDLDAYMADV